MPFIDHYKLLGVSSNATEEEIKAAYRKLSKKFHPDMNDGDTFFADRFKDIQVAYDILSDRNRRAAYRRQYDSFYQDAGSQNLYNTDTPPKRKRNLKPILLLIPVVLIGIAIFFTEGKANENKALPYVKKDTNYAIVENVDSLINLQTRKDISGVNNGNFRIILHQYTNYDTGYKTFQQLLTYGYHVIFFESPDGRYQIVMPFNRPVADIVIVRDSIERVFGTKCTVSR